MKRGRTRWQLRDSNSVVDFNSGAARKQSASLPTNQLAIHRILLIRAGERDPTTNHCPDNIDEPRQAPWNQQRTSEPRRHTLHGGSWGDLHFILAKTWFTISISALVPIYTKITQFSTWWRTGTTFLVKKQECQVCLEDFHYLKLFHYRKLLPCKTVFYVFKYVQIPAGSIYSFKIHVVGGEVNIIWSFAPPQKTPCTALDQTILFQKEEEQFPYLCWCPQVPHKRGSQLHY